MKFSEIQESFPLEIEENTIFTINTKSVTYLTHDFHKYPGKFIPQVPKWAIEKYLSGLEGKIILDPFCGSGTTLVEALLHHHNCIGIDIDPLSVLISKVKTTVINLKKLNEINEWLINSINQEEIAEFKPSCATINHWFTNDAINKLSIIRSLIDKIPVLFGNNRDIIDIQDLLIICFSSIIRKVSNADNQSQKTYVSHTNKKIPEDVKTLFLKQLGKYIQDITAYTKLIKSTSKSIVICTSSVDGINKVIDGKIDLAITSPPYIKAIDYIYNQMVEFFWIGDYFDMDTQKKQNLKKQNYIGNKQIRKEEYSTYSPYERLLSIKELDLKLQNIYSEDVKNGFKHSYITYKYFIEMEAHFKSINKLLQEDSHYIMVVGNSNVSNINLNTADYLAEIAGRNGFKLDNKWGYKIRNRFMRFDRKGRGGLIQIEWVLDFRKNTK
ncbi:MAG: hypothetical protein K9M99_06295 [Candidatus Cloacimonetes bacterium]|nr:hypothetical protein [Candidatus Cloacimonadota bacterium]